MRDRAEVARQPHKLKVGGSIPPPATNNYNTGVEYDKTFNRRFALHLLEYSTKE